MRILLDLRHLKFGSINGVARFSMTLFEYYKTDTRVETVTLILSDPRLLNDFPQHDCFVVKGNPFLPPSILTTSFLCWRLRHTIDIIHFCNYSSHLWPLPKTVHVIVTIHDLMFMTCKDFYKSSRFKFFKTFYFKKLVNIAVNNCNQIQTVSDYTKNNLNQNFPVSKEKNILVSAPLADKSSIGYNVENEPLFKDRYLVYVGSDRSHKQLSWIIDEVNNQENSSYILLVIGAKNDNGVSGSCVHFLENVSDGELQNIYRFAEANILMSIDEGYGLSVKEAAANMCVSILPAEVHFKQFEDLEILWIERRSGLAKIFLGLWGMSDGDVFLQKERVMQRYISSSHNDEYISSLYKGLLTRG